MSSAVHVVGIKGIVFRLKEEKRREEGGLQPGNDSIAVLNRLANGDKRQTFREGPQQARLYNHLSMRTSAHVPTYVQYMHVCR